MNNNPTRRQHYVPEFLLKLFLRESPQLWVHDTLAKKTFQAGPNSVAVESWFYSVEPASEPDGVDWDARTVVEDWFAANIDGPGSAVVPAVIGKQRLDARRFADFVRFVAAQMFRTSAGLQRVRESLEPVEEEKVKRMLRHDIKKLICAKLDSLSNPETALKINSSVFPGPRFLVHGPIHPRQPPCPRFPAERYSGRVQYCPWSSNGFGTSMTSSPSKGFWNGDEDVATPFRLRALSGCALWPIPTIDSARKDLLPSTHPSFTL